VAVIWAEVRIIPKTKQAQQQIIWEDYVHCSLTVKFLFIMSSLLGAKQCESMILTVLWHLQEAVWKKLPDLFWETTLLPCTCCSPSKGVLPRTNLQWFHNHPIILIDSRLLRIRDTESQFNKMLISIISWQSEEVVVQLTQISSKSYMNAGKNWTVFGVVYFTGGDCFWRA
jgi:hypothetical protein